jgi:beta-phosphoglucomutase family hydrolase
MRSQTPGRLGLPPAVRGALFDLDGVLTRTAVVHEAAWKDAFDAVLSGLADQEPFSHLDYLRFVDGKPREAGVRDFFTSRGVTLPEGSPDDPADVPSVQGVAHRKNEALLEHLRRDGVEVYDGSVRYLHACADAGIRRAVVSSSANTTEVLEAAGLMPLVEAQVDGLIAKDQGLPGKPAPDTFLKAAAELGLPPEDCAVFEDALAGVAAGRAGGFGLVVGVDRVGQAEQLTAHGADVVVTDLGELL